jgi:hypothetical protein
VVFDGPHADGALWIRGETYKARVDDTGVMFAPWFRGAGAHTPIHFRWQGAAGVEPQRVGNSVHFRHRRDLVEVWEPRETGMEQLFIVSAPPEPGDMVVNIEVTTDLEFRGYRGGLVFAAPGLGEVSYGEGIVFDARGERAPIVPRLQVAPLGGKPLIALRVSESFLAQAAYPITIDPFVGNFAVGANTRNQLHPDIVREPLSGDFVVVYEEVFNSSDHDILMERFKPDGTFVGSVVLETAADLCVDPKVCAIGSGSKVLAVWDNNGAAKGIQARGYSLSLNIADPIAAVTSDGALEDSRTPDVGGGIRFPTIQLGQIAVFVRRTGGVNFSLRGVELQSNGIPTGGEFVIDGTPGCEPRPDIAPTGGVPLHWAVVWQKRNALCGDADIWWAPVNLGGLMQPAAELEGDSDDETDPRVFTAGSDSLVCWVQPTTSFGLDVDAVLLRRSGSSFAQVGPKISLPAAEPGAPRGANQTAIAIGFEGCRHSYAYMEDQRPRAACVATANGAYLYSEGHVSLSATTNSCTAPAMTYVPSDASSVRYAVVWEEDMGSHIDVRGAFYDGRRASGGVSVVESSCGRLQTGITAQGIPAIGQVFEVELSNVAGIPAIFVGQPTTPIPLCSTVPGPCRLGAFPLLATVASARFNTRIPCDPFLIGGSLAFQGFDVGAPFGCTFGVELRTTDTLVVTFQ